jgi:LacI family transcriptional regulator
MKFEATTLKDIAQALGLSTSTVSRALRQSYEVSEETRQRVFEYAQKLNYHPNPIALSLRERKSRSIGVIVSEIANSFFSQAINGIESIATTGITMSSFHKATNLTTGKSSACKTLQPAPLTGC